MRTISNDDVIRIGTGAGKFIKSDLNSAQKSVKIVSPYLTPSYVEDLLKLAKKGVDVMLITSNSVREGDGIYSSLSHSDLIKQKKHSSKKMAEKRSNGLTASVFSVLIPIIFFMLEYYVIGAILLGGVIASFYYFYNLRVYSYSYYTPIKLKVVPDEYHGDYKNNYLIHSKIYVIDDRIAYIGSVNFTHRAFFYNYEVMTKVTSSKAVEDISNEVKRLFTDDNVASIDIDEWGSELYEEPPN